MKTLAIAALALLLGGCASTYWKANENQLAWVRSGTGVYEAKADIEVCQDLLVPDQPLMGVSTSVESLAATFLVYRFLEYRGRSAFRSCMTDMGYSLSFITDTMETLQ